jgi:hypothetical protein
LPSPLDAPMARRLPRAFVLRPVDFRVIS